jgi:hypothetical protein
LVADTPVGWLARTFRVQVTDANDNYSLNKLIHLRHRNASNAEVTRIA